MPDSFAIPTNWTFRDESVAAGFERHVREQLPWYDLATGAVAHVARHYVPEFGLVYDLGASTGNIGRALAPTLKARSANLIAIEASAEMSAIYDAPGLGGHGQDREGSIRALRCRGRVPDPCSCRSASGRA